MTLTVKELSKYTRCLVNQCHMKSHCELQITIKLCPSGAQTCALPLFCDRDLEINPMTLKLAGYRDILKMYPRNENEAASLKHSKLSLN